MRPPMFSSRVPGVDVIIGGPSNSRRFRRGIASTASVCSPALQVDGFPQRFRCRIPRAVPTTGCVGQVRRLSTRRFRRCLDCGSSGLSAQRSAAIILLGIDGS